MTIVLEKLSVAQQVNSYRIIYETRKFLVSNLRSKI
jgi:hypothetical protein